MTALAFNQQGCPPRCYAVLDAVSSAYPPVTGRLLTCSAPFRRSPPKYCYLALPLDLHVLSLPLAFILSQDQTLLCIYTISQACPDASDSKRIDALESILFSVLVVLPSNLSKISFIAYFPDCRVSFPLQSVTTAQVAPSFIRRLPCPRKNISMNPGGLPGKNPFEPKKSALSSSADCKGTNFFQTAKTF